MKEADKPPGTQSLSGREREVVELAAQGLSDKEIAAKLDISVGTLGTYWARIRTKLGLRWRTEIVAQFVREQLGESLSESAVLDAMSIPVAVVANNGAIEFGNRALWGLLGAAGHPSGLNQALVGILAFEEGEPLEARLGCGGHFSGIAAVGRDGPGRIRGYVRAWPIAGSRRWVMVCEPLAMTAAVSVEPGAVQK